MLETSFKFIKKKVLHSSFVTSLNINQYIFNFNWTQILIIEKKNLKNVFLLLIYEGQPRKKNNNGKNLRD